MPLNWLLDQPCYSTLQTVSKLFQSNFKPHSKTFSLHIPVSNSIPHKFLIKGELTKPAADGSYNFAETIANSRHKRPTERQYPSSIPSSLKLIHKLWRIAKNIQPRSNTNKWFHNIHLTNPIDMLLLERSVDLNRWKIYGRILNFNHT